MKRTEHMSEEQQENVAEELTEWSEIDLSPEDKKEKVEFEVDGFSAVLNSHQHSRTNFNLGIK